MDSILPDKAFTKYPILLYNIFNIGEGEITLTALQYKFQFIFFFFTQIEKQTNGLYE